MNFVSQPHHPNGFKIAFALALTGNKLQYKEVKVVQDGAVLQVADPDTRAMFGLAANSAVLYLFSSTSSNTLLKDQTTEAWLSWEATVLQRRVWWQLLSSSGGREDKTARAALQQVLSKLENHFNSSKQPFVAGSSLGASDVVLLATLLPLKDSSLSTILSQLPALNGYMDRAFALPAFSSMLCSWFGCESSAALTLKPWLNAGPSATPLSPQVADNTLFTLTKGAPGRSPSLTPSTDTSSEQQPRKATAAEVAAAEECWSKGSPTSTLRSRAKTVPVLPVAGERNIMVTSALPYVNNVPHLGNIIGCVLSADCFVRFCRLREDNVVYICGTDEYGTATETKAIAEGTTPKQICDRYHKIHSDVYKAFNISFDHFGRTTTPNQEEIVHELFWDLEGAGNITRESVEQLYCTACARFLADRFVEGVCPHIGCGYEDARGDQCDGCGKLVNAAELIKPRCKLCSATPTIRSSKHLFIDLPKIEGEMRKWFNESSKNWSHNAGTICNSWLRDGLLPRCITRDLKWGVPVPVEGYQDKVFYVWFDAPIGYISITKEYTKDWEKWWKNPQQVQLYQFMAKDNVPFHGIIFPCTLTGSPKPWTRVNNLMATEYLNYEEGKFSKSRGVGVFGDQAMDTGIPSDVWRFYLLYIRPESHDTVFSWSDLQLKNNSELLNNLGNFVNRSLKFVSQFFGGVVPQDKPSESDFAVMASINNEIQNYSKALASCRLRDGLRHILAISRIGNLYIQDNEPYKLIKPDRTQEDKERGASVIAISVNIVYLLALLLEPYMPDTCSKILRFLNKPDASQSRLPTALCRAVVPGDKVTAPEPLIQKITDDQIKAWQEKFKGKSDDTKPKKVVATASGAGDVKSLLDQVAQQGEKVRALKAGGASKGDVAPEVAVLLSLKKQLAAAQDAAKNGAGAAAKSSGSSQADVDRLQTAVTAQGEKVRALKAGGASKADVAPEVAVLLDLKKQLAAAQAAVQASASTVNSSNAASAVSQADVDRLQASVTAQGEKVRAVKAGGASKADVAPEVAVLLDLKKQLAAAQTAVQASGAETKAGDSAEAKPVVDQAEVDRLQALVTAQGDKVRALKTGGAAKETVAAEVAALLQLKQQLATASGEDPNAAQGKQAKSKKKKK